MFPSEDQARVDIVEVGRRLWVQGFVASNDGNISVRLAADRILTTPTGVSKGFMTPGMCVVTDMDGVKVTLNLERLVERSRASLSNDRSPKNPY